MLARAIYFGLPSKKTRQLFNARTVSSLKGLGAKKLLTCTFLDDQYFPFHSGLVLDNKTTLLKDIFLAN